MELEHMLARAESLAYRISSEFNGQPLPEDERACAAIGCLTVAQQHHSAIIILFRNDMPVHAAAFALIRHQIETAFNALWLWYCATDDEIARFMQDGSGKTVRQLVAQVDGVLAGRAGDEASIIRSHWSQLSDFVFSGERRIRHWLDANVVDAIYSEDAVAELVDLSNSIAELGLATYRSLSGGAADMPVAEQPRDKAVK
ncbi:DUF6988 family protein [Herbaspirillum robiniae]|uniref:Uncharacterized protein n=1 Tax=Herbaspirillum robiniae TaxID=2014887 RepID=A0A246WU38_9BURK|nr:DUF5677 domain-containing protein [Herbaspirillum robiniae]NUU01394.1 hypothetical protein [Herbaspirillum robiniae]OWY30583.1 hypothetical protein CEJ42_00395 [Herbaspirillum robiniae]